VVTQEYLDTNPELAKSGVKLGETIGIPEPTNDLTPEAVAAGAATLAATKPAKGEPISDEPMLAIHNVSTNRSITQVISGKTYTIGAGRVAELPKSIADKILLEWPNAKIAVSEEAIAAAEPWENGYPDVLARARAEHSAKGFQVKDTVGPRRPKVKEPPIPKDMQGKPDEKANVFVCPNCVAQFTTLLVCREHQKSEHGT